MGKGCNGLGRILVRIQGAVTGTQWTMYTRRTWFFWKARGVYRTRELGATRRNSHPLWRRVTTPLSGARDGHIVAETHMRRVQQLPQHGRRTKKTTKMVFHWTEIA